MARGQAELGRVDAVSATVAGYRVLEAVVRMTPRGAWFADVVSDEAPTTLAGVVVFDAPGATLTGSVVRCGDYSVGMTNRTSMRLVGGRGGLSKPLAPTTLRKVTPSAIASATCRAAGEVLSTSATFPAGTLDAWARIAGTAGAAFDALCDEQAISTWTVLDDGSIWFGAYAWQPSPLDAADPPITSMDSDAGIGWATYAVDSLAARPGQTIGGIRIAAVEHRIDVRGMRTEVRYA